MSTIKVENLSKTFTYYKKDVGLKSSIKNLFNREKLYKDAVKGISLEIDKGEIVGFLGPNGAGKTTTLKMLCGILFPTSGSATIEDFTPWERNQEFKKKISIVMGQKNQLWWDLPANESLYLNKCIYEIDTKEYNNTIGQLSEILDIKDLLKVQVRRLSLGERMKLEILAALLHKPEVIFLDEPTIGLDLVSQRNIRKFLKYYNEQNKATIILTSHYMNDVVELCKRGIIINEGRIVYDGLLKDVNNVFESRKIVKLRLSDCVEECVLENYGVVKENTEENVIIEIEKEELKKCTQKMLECLPIIDFIIEDIPIEEGIELLYRKEVAK